MFSSFQELLHGPLKNHLPQQQLANSGHPFLSAPETMILHVMFWKDVQQEGLRKRYHPQQCIVSQLFPATVKNISDFKRSKIC